jgi:hypothetical protein
MASINVRQDTGLRAVLRPKEAGIAIVSEAAGELPIEYFNEMNGWYSRAVNFVAEVRPRDSLQVRHHQSGWNSFTADIGTEDPNSFRAEIEEIVQIATN